MNVRGFFKLKFFPYIKEAVAFGHDRDYCSAFVNIDLEAVGNWAEKNNVAYASYQELASNPDVVDIIAGCIDKVNADLAGDADVRALEDLGAPARAKPSAARFTTGSTFP